MMHRTRKLFYLSCVALLSVSGVVGLPGISEHVNANSHLNNIIFNHPAKKTAVRNSEPKMPKLTVASNYSDLQQQAKDLSKKAGKSRKKNDDRKALIYSQQESQVRSQLAKVKSSEIYYTHSPRMRAKYNWYVDNGLKNCDKLYDHNKMYRYGFDDSEKVTSTNPEIRKKYLNSKSYKKGWIVGYTSYVTNKKSYPKSKAYQRAFKLFAQGSMYNRKNNINQSYLEFSNIWSKYNF